MAPHTAVKMCQILIVELSVTKQGTTLVLQRYVGGTRICLPWRQWPYALKSFWWYFDLLLLKENKTKINIKIKTQPYQRQKNVKSLVDNISKGTFKTNHASLEMRSLCFWCVDSFATRRTLLTNACLLRLIMPDLLETKIGSKFSETTIFAYRVR